MLAAVPPELDGVTLDARMERMWPGMDSTEVTARPARPAPRGGWAGRSSGSRAAGPATPATSPTRSPLTVDGLGPRGGGAHTPGEFVLEPTLRERAEVALAIALEVLA